jgi:hypothetical protein
VNVDAIRVSEYLVRLLHTGGHDADVAKTNGWLIYRTSVVINKSTDHKNVFASTDFFFRNHLFGREHLGRNDPELMLGLVDPNGHDSAVISWIEVPFMQIKIENISLPIVGVDAQNGRSLGGNVPIGYRIDECPVRQPGGHADQESSPAKVLARAGIYL